MGDSSRHPDPNTYDGKFSPAACVSNNVERENDSCHLGMNGQRVCLKETCLSWTHIRHLLFSPFLSFNDLLSGYDGGIISGDL